MALRCTALRCLTQLGRFKTGGKKVYGLGCRVGWYVAGALLLVAHGATAQTLHDRIRAAVEADPRVQAARSTHESRLVDARGAKSLYLPVLRATGATGSSRSQDPLVRAGDKKTYGLELTQPIPLFGHESARLALANTAATVDAAEVGLVEQQVVADVLEALLGVEYAQGTLELRERLQSNIRQQVDAVHAAVAGGGIAASESRLVQSRAAQSAALLAQAQAQLSAAQSRLMRLVPGGLSLVPLRDDDLRSWWTSPVTFQALRDNAASAAPLRKARAQTDLAQAEYAVARTDLWPRLHVTMQGQKGEFGGVSADSQSVFVGVDIPLFEGGNAISRSQSAALRHQAARSALDQETRMLDQRLAEAWEQWRASESAAASWREAEQQDAAALTLMEEQVQGGATTHLVWLRAQQNALENRVQGVEATWQSRLAWVRLLQEAGALTVSQATPAQEPVEPAAPWSLSVFSGFSEHFVGPDLGLPHPFARSR
ncbi:TolC family protein [Candidatus Symbiobacter mobilis]|uniref:TolC family protein n=1 Tax=Candidatus Symbiobacter mobilis TaxID=1436290 RepID=UPI0016515911|nr:TolC family protein [Candidatus Symbiobacter mobilis]